MSLSATVTPKIKFALGTFLHDPVVEPNTVKRDNIYLAVEKKRSDGTKQSMALDSRDFNSFGDRVKEIVVLDQRETNRSAFTPTFMNTGLNWTSTGSH